MGIKKAFGEAIGDAFEKAGEAVGRAAKTTLGQITAVSPDIKIHIGQSINSQVASAAFGESEIRTGNYDLKAELKKPRARIYIRPPKKKKTKN